MAVAYEIDLSHFLLDIPSRNESSVVAFWKSSAYHVLYPCVRYKLVISWGVETMKPWEFGVGAIAFRSTGCPGDRG